MKPTALAGSVTSVGELLDENRHDDTTTVDASEKLPLSSIALLENVDPTTSSRTGQSCATLGLL